MRIHELRRSVLSKVAAAASHNDAQTLAIVLGHARASNLLNFYLCSTYMREWYSYRPREAELFSWPWALVPGQLIGLAWSRSRALRAELLPIKERLIASDVSEEISAALGTAGQRQSESE